MKKISHNISTNLIKNFQYKLSSLSMSARVRPVPLFVLHHILIINVYNRIRADKKL